MSPTKRRRVRFGGRGVLLDPGLIATLERGAEVEVRHFDSIRSLVKWCDDNDARIRTICTEGTIYRDLQGSRRRAIVEGESPFLQLPEPAMLGKRKDLLA